ncbi:DNA-binding transcription factor [Saxophila tyrrhenica]|uniref:DNA-binding transcription factor n=1 Tax=Saxophila tyrrhenica TaxID=1690608 RepID=A0AAV9PD95_9PEZI|nr:DNA-binding transcription factor [Saxophila tyrrhenica]
MSSQTRDRSPSQASHAQYISKHASGPNNHPPLDPSFVPDPTLSHGQYTSFGAHQGHDLLSDPTFGQGDQSDFFLDTSNYPQLPRTQHLPLHDPSIANHTFLQSSGIGGQGASSGYPYSQGGQGSNHVSPGALSQGTSPSGANESSAFPSFDFNPNFDSSASLDPSMLNDLHPETLNIDTSNNGSMAAMQQSHTPTPPHLLPDTARRSSNSPSPSTSPSYAHNQFGVNRPRNTSESLDPSSAMFPQGQADWSSMNLGGYRGHRRTPSDNYSDYSSHSNQASPYLPTMDSFDSNAHSSPLLNSQDPTFNNDLGLQQFSLNDNSPQQQHPPQQSYHSPGHSPHISPRLMAQQHALPQFTADNNFGMNPDMHFQPQQNGLEMFPGVGQEPFPSLSHNNSVDLSGNADQMSPPEISINYAPPTQPVENARPGNNDGEALSPPMRTQSRNRIRAKSDSYAGSRSPSPSIAGRGRSPSLQPELSGEKLSPYNDPVSRSSSPGRSRNGSLGRGRSTSNASDQRDYILNLAEPERTPSNGAKEGRVQKHPATFQCTLCPKRFTRAYNLRSHLRTHTDERPFVCTVCGKAFARQHDRKRHEGLHSGEKKFVCKGHLNSGGTWGCGRRFARADALGRHFRSEAGRVCIKPLLDEEAAERQKAWMEEQQQAQVAAGLVAPQPLMQQPQQVDMMGNFLPAALLAQYPALAGLDWNAIGSGPTAEEDYSGRSSFDASSGGEYYEDLSESEMGSYPDPSQMGLQNNLGMQAAQAGPQQGQQQGAFGYGGGGGHGDYLSDFEGR